MRFSFTQSSMLRSLQRVMGAISTKVPMPSLSNLHLKLDQRTLTVTATDLEITVSSQVPLSDADGQGGVLVQARRFQDLIRELPDVMLEIEVDDVGRVKLKGDNTGHYTLPGGDPMDYPELPNVDARLALDLPSDVLRRMVSKTIFAVSHDDMRPILTGLLLQVRPDQLTVVATDGHRLSRVIRSDISYDGENRDVTVPEKALNLVMRNLSESDTPTIGLAETRAAFSSGDYRLITRLIDGNYPKYEGVIPTGNPGRMIVNTGELMAAVRRVAIFASQLSRQVKLTLSGSSMKLESEDSDIGSKAEESVSIDYNGSPIEIAYNAGYLMDVLKQVDTEEVLFELGTSNDAAVIRPTVQHDGEDLLMLLMPIRIR